MATLIVEALRGEGTRVAVFEVTVVTWPDGNQRVVAVGPRELGGSLSPLAMTTGIVDEIGVVVLGIRLTDDLQLLVSDIRGHPRGRGFVAIDATENRILVGVGHPPKPPPATPSTHPQRHALRSFARCLKVWRNVVSTTPPFRKV